MRRRQVLTWLVGTALRLKFVGRLLGGDENGSVRSTMLLRGRLVRGVIASAEDASSPRMSLMLKALLNDEGEAGLSIASKSNEPSSSSNCS